MATRRNQCKILLIHNCLNNFVVSGSSFHEFETRKNDVFQHNICCSFKRKRPRDDKLSTFSK